MNRALSDSAGDSAGDAGDSGESSDEANLCLPGSLSAWGILVRIRPRHGTTSATLVVDELAARLGISLAKHRRAHADTADGRPGDERVTLLRSRSYMNESGGPVKAAADYAKVPIDHVIVVQDELDIPFGAIRLKAGGGDGGQMGFARSRRQ